MNTQERIAVQIFNKYGLDFKDAKRAGGWTNAVWLNGDFALRLSLKKDSERIRREVELAHYFPNEIGYPVNVEVGFTDGFEWSLSKRIYANNLSEVWPSLNWNNRIETIKQLLSISNSLHTVDIIKIESLSNKTPWYSSLNTQETYSLLKKFKDERVISSEQLDIIHCSLERFWQKYNSTIHVLNHGDITMDNLLWSNGKIVSLMDFEHSVIGPLELDLHSIINLALFYDEYANNNEFNTIEYKQYKEQIIGLLKPLVSNSYSSDLILGYAILYRMKFIEFWLNDKSEKLEDLDAYIKLCSLTDGKGGYLSEIIYGYA